MQHVFEKFLLQWNTHSPILSYTRVLLHVISHIAGGGTINTRDVSDEPEKNATGSEEIITQFVKKENLEICEEKLFQTEMEYTNCDKVKIVDSCDKVIKREPECFNENSAGSKFLKSTEEDVEIFEFADQKLQIKSDVEIYDEYSSDSPEYLSTTDVLEYGLQQEMSDKTAEGKCFFIIAFSLYTL